MFRTMSRTNKCRSQQMQNTDKREGATTRILQLLAYAHLRCAALVLAAMVLAIAAGCAGEPEVVEVEVVEEVEVLASTEPESRKAAVRESDATSARTGRSSASSALDSTAPTKTPTPYPTLAPVQVREVSDHGENIGPDLVRQTPDDTPNPDDAILAAETGLSMGRIASAMASQGSFGEYAHELIKQFPDQISAVWMDSPPGTEGPNTRGNIRFTGTIPTDIKTMDNVVLTGDGLISMADHKRRAEVAAMALSDLGYNNFMTGYEPRKDVIDIEILLPEGVVQSSKSDLIPEMRRTFERIPELQGRAALLEAADIELTVLRGDGPFIILDDGSSDD